MVGVVVFGAVVGYDGWARPGRGVVGLGGWGGGWMWLSDVMVGSLLDVMTGAVAGGDTDFAQHMTSLLILFVDIVKTFDKVLRELVLGFPQYGRGDRIAHLVTLGLSHAEASWICDYIEKNETAFEQWG